MCKQAKAAQDTYQGLLQPLPVSEWVWIDIIIDFVMGLPKYKAYRQIYDVILIIIDWLFKERHYILCSEKDEHTLAEVTTNLFLQNI